VGQGKIEGHLRREKIVLTNALHVFINTILPTIIVLGILIFVHELGHFLLAKRLGVGVLTFSLGFGPKLIGRKIGETQYKISAVPLGGFVKLIGENPEDETKEEDRSRSFSTQPIWKRLSIICAGPFFNLFLAVVLFSSINLFVGIPSPLSSKIGDVSPGFPAENAGLKKGDVVLSIDGEEVSKWDDLSQIIRKSKGKELLIKVKRNGETLELKVIPKLSTQKSLFGEEIKTFVIGISPHEEVAIQRVNMIVALGTGFFQTWQVTKLTIIGIVKLIQRVVPATEIGSPIMIAKLAGEQAKRGIMSLVFFMAIISINLGLLNLFPIPILDGGYLLFLGLEAVLRRPLSTKKMEIAQQMGLIFIILLMLFAIRNDLIRYFFPGGFKF
jgi:regulator of sigma E protease